METKAPRNEPLSPQSSVEYLPPEHASVEGTNRSPAFAPQTSEARAASGLARLFGLDPRVAALAIVLDTMLFGGEVFSAGIFTLFSILAGAIFGFVTYKAQKKWYGDDHDSALIKGLIMGLLTAIPTNLPAFLYMPAGVVGLLHVVRKKKIPSQPRSLAEGRSMDIKGLFEEEFKKTEPDRLEAARIDRELDAAFEAGEQRKISLKKHRQVLVHQAHNLVKPVLEEFVRSANQVVKEKLKLSRTTISAPEETKPHFNYEITQAFKSGVKVFGLVETRSDSRVLSIHFSASDVLISIHGDSTYKHYSEKDLPNIQEQVAKDLVEMTKYSL